LSVEEAQEILNHFDSNKNGSVDFNEFIRTLKGELNERRIACVRKAYNILDVNGDGLVKLDDIAKIYDASCHPEVLSGHKTERDLFMEFMSLWDTQEKDGIVTFDEFCQYYSDISAGVETDDEFDAIMQNAWKY
jgi:Ca2+-binding EF-hand superfamily protein